MNCTRCNKQLKQMWVLSVFDHKQICLACFKKEAAHPQYQEAEVAEMKAIAVGNREYQGIGKPADL